MLLKFFDQTFDYRNEVSSIEEVFNKINFMLDQSDLHFSHLLIDDQEVYGDFDTYIFERIEELELIEVKVKTVKEFVQDLLLYCEEYLVQALPLIEGLTEEFYQESNDETWDKFQQLLEALQWIVEMIQSIDQSSYEPNEWINYLNVTSSLNEELLNLEEALENRDSILIGDIIQYEILEILQGLSKQVTRTIDEEFDRPDTN